MPATRVDFWMEKFERNKLRDRAVRRQLRRLDWDVLVIWECQTRDVDRVAALVSGFLDN